MMCLSRRVAIALLGLLAGSACSASRQPSYAPRIEWPTPAIVPDPLSPPGEVEVYPLPEGAAAPVSGLLFSDAAEAVAEQHIEVAKARLAAERAGRAADRALAQRVVEVVHDDLAAQLDAEQRRTASVQRWRDMAVGIAVLEAVVIGVLMVSVR